MAAELLEHQFHVHRDANGQFCNIDTPLQPLASPPSSITALYAKTQQALI